MPLVSGSPIVDARDSYTYFVSIFTQDGNIGTSLKLHVGLHLAAKQVMYGNEIHIFRVAVCRFPLLGKENCL